jgi:hypothetical protein
MSYTKNKLNNNDVLLETIISSDLIQALVDHINQAKR